MDVVDLIILHLRTRGKKQNMFYSIEGIIYHFDQ